MEITRYRIKYDISSQCNHCIFFSHLGYKKENKSKTKKHNLKTEDSENQTEEIQKILRSLHAYIRQVGMDGLNI